MVKLAKISLHLRHDVATLEKRLLGSELVFVHFYLILDPNIRFLCTTLLN